MPFRTRGLKDANVTGLDLESFLLLLRADLVTWAVLGLGSLALALLVWSCWGSRRALRKCLVLSLAIHLGLVLYGSTVPAVRSALRGAPAEAADRPHLRKIRVTPQVDSSRPGSGGTKSRRDGESAVAGDPSRPSGPQLELANAPLRLSDASLRVARPGVVSPAEPRPEAAAPPIAVGSAIPRPARLGTDSSPARLPVEPKPTTNADPSPPAPSPPNLAEVDRASTAAPLATVARRPAGDGLGTGEEALGTRDRSLRDDPRLRPGRPGEGEPERDQRGVAAPSLSRPGRGVPDSRGGPGGQQAGSGTREVGRALVGSPTPPAGHSDDPVPLERATPRSRSIPEGGSGLAVLDVRPPGRNLEEIPKVYRPRLDPDRPNQAQRHGASAASELAVERALDWLARHQDPRDGRWDGGTARFEDGTPVPGDDDFTVHCPAGETCFGECAYWEADTALTGLALLTYLGAGYAHNSGRHAETVGKGFDFLIGQQGPDGDLRGRSRVVGMYCHAMATLALCEGYALTGDPRLRDAAGRAVAFLVRARARDGLAWRYAPGAPVGDTSILGWVVMGLKSAKEVGISIPEETAVRRGTLSWLDRVAAGRARGLARYQPEDPVTPTMTAEAWVCRQFLGVGGPGPSSTEAADSLLRNDSDRGPTNFYYWYYATLALYQHGGESWSRWNPRIRDRIVDLQRTTGHATGSWDPDESLYGTKGGRIYCTALAAMTLEVYYRYLRLYDEPRIPPPAGATPPARSADREAQELPPTAGNPEDR
jgi:hypothetical protein